MNSLLLGIGLSCVLLAACGRPLSESATASAVKGAAAQDVGMDARASGLETRYFDAAVRPQDDLYRHINGKWLDSTAIPVDKARYGAFNELADATEAQLRVIVDGLLQDKTLPAHGEARKIRDLYVSFMDEARLQAVGLQSLQARLDAIDKLNSASALSAYTAQLVQIGVNVPLVPYVHQDNRDATRYAVDLYQAGLGLPDRDYYLQDGEDGTYEKIRAAYREHIATMLKLAGQPQAAADAQRILQLETALAKAQWDKVTNRDPIKTYNKYPLDQLDGLAPGVDWSLFMRAAGISDRVDYLLVSQPSYVAAYGRLLHSEPLQTWKQYLKLRVISEFSPYLARDFVDANFAFSGTVLRGIPENRPRWKRGLTLLESAIGEGLGRLYVAKYFPPENQRRMAILIGNLLAAYRQSINDLDWMSEPTRRAAQEKLAKLTVKIGYPRQWRDYSTLQIVQDDLLGNVMRAQQFEYQRQIDKLGRSVDRDEWQMTPQTVNAYYNPELNEIVFPAAILQPPFFNAQADDAVNYGGIGAVIGHEISHGFDDQGSQYDGDGNLRDWWTPADHAQFTARTQALVAQYSAYEPVPGYKVNGALTLGENIADNSGLAIAHKAYVLSLQGRPAPVMDGLSGEQRFFAGWAQVWRNNIRAQEEIRLLTTDPHAPDRFRAWGAAVNQPAFHEAFAVRPGDGMYLPPERRVTIW